MNTTEAIRRLVAALWLSALPPATALCQPADESEFGRFFTTPGTRAELDNARANYTLERPPPSASRQTEAPKLQEVKLNGVVLRGDGTGRAWVNHSTDVERTGVVESVSIDSAGGNRPLVAVTMPGGKQVTLRPGEVFSLETGRVTDSFQQGGADPMARPDTETASEEQNEQADDTEEQAEVEEFDESELADRDVRILLLEKRLEKLESSISGSEGENTHTNSQQN